MPVTYESYLCLPELLDLQQPKSDPVEHDEPLFIVIHQTYELWFKLMLHEFEKVGRNFRAGELWEAVHTLKRCRTIMKTLVNQIDILETMTPMSFTSFRDRLDTSSGFQSTQFRELEFMLGYKRPNVMKLAGINSGVGWERAIRRLEEPSLIDHFHRYLADAGADIPAEVLDRDVSQPHVSNPKVQDELVRLYRERPDMGILLELMTDFDEGLQEWRYRHVKMVERTIGDKQGTGGSPGVEFLRQSLFKPTFPDLWAIRSRL
ncbi:MAG: tryptophan 2,3-dioxygenase [Phycisphaerales bacterium]